MQQWFSLLSQPFLGLDTYGIAISDYLRVPKTTILGASAIATGGEDLSKLPMCMRTHIRIKVSKRRPTFTFDTIGEILRMDP